MEEAARHMEEMSRNAGMLAVMFRKCAKRQISSNAMAEEWTARADKVISSWNKVNRAVCGKAK